MHNGKSDGVCMELQLWVTRFPFSLLIADHKIGIEFYTGCTVLALFPIHFWRTERHHVHAAAVRHDIVQSFLRLCHLAIRVEHDRLLCDAGK